MSPAMDVVDIAEAGPDDSNNHELAAETLVNGSSENKFQRAISAWRSE